ADALLSAAQWEVSKALAPVANGVLEAWAATRGLDHNIDAIRTELLLVKATLENAARKDLGGSAMEMMLERLRVSAHTAQDLLDELDYFRIQGTYYAADLSAFVSARHTAKGVSKLFNCCRWHSTKRRQMPRSDSSSAPDVNQEVSGCMSNLCKLLPCSSSPDPHVPDEDFGDVQETPQLMFDRVHFSRMMKEVVEKLNLMRKDINGVLQSRDTRSLPNIAQNRPISKGQVDEPNLYGRDRIMDSIIRDIFYGQYCDKAGLTVLLVLGPGGIGKTTLIQHIYCDERMQQNFEVMIWICVSVNFNLDKVLEHIRTCTPEVRYERRGSTTEELIEERLRSKRFLLVLDDMWQFTDVDDWKKLLLILGKSQPEGSVILVTTRFQAIAQKVKTTGHSIKLNGLETEAFRRLFFAFVFGDEGCPRDKNFLLETGDKIIEKLKGSPLAAKTAGRLLYKGLNLHHWKRVLESKGWEKENADNDIMPTLKLSYDFLPFHLQQCFACSALFPEDYHFRSDELINLWIGLDILIPSGQNQTFEDIGLSNLNELVMHGFFKQEEIDDGSYYFMHLMHDLALKVASHDYLSLRLHSVGSVEIQSTTRHLSISTDDLGKYDAVSGRRLKSELEELKTKFKVEDLQTLMLFGEMDEGFVKIFGDFFREANALRILRLPNMLCPVESMIYNFSRLLHLRYLSLGTEETQMHIPLSISKFYHLKILDLELWDGRRDLPEDISNLAKLCHFYVPSDDQLHFDIYNVGKLKLLEELKVFQVNKKSEGFEPKQLEHLTMLRELGMYNLEKIYTVEEAAQAKLMEKTYLRRLTLDWDSKRSSVEPGVEAAVLDSLKPHGDLQVLCIRGHGGPSCPTWLGDEFAVEALHYLCLVGVSWEVLPSVGKTRNLRKLVLKHIATVKEFVIEQSFRWLIWFELVGLESLEKWVPSSDAHHIFPLLQVLIIRDCPKLLEFPFSNHIVYRPDQDWDIDWFPRLQELEIQNCPELSLVPPIPWTETLCSVSIRGAMLLDKLVYSNSSDGVRLDIVGKDDLGSLDQVLAFKNLTQLEELSLLQCPPLELKHLVLLTSLKRLIAESSDALIESLRGQGDVEWQLPIEHIEIQELCDNSGKELTELLTHLPWLSELKIIECGKITHLAVGVDQQEMTSAASEAEKNEKPEATEWEKEDGVLQFPAHLSYRLRELVISHCPELVLVAPPTLLPDGGGGLQALQYLERLKLKETPKFVSAYLFASPSCHLFPSSLQFLELNGVEGMGTVEPLSNLTSLTLLELRNCGEDLRCKGLGPLLTARGQLSALIVYGSPRFFAGWDPNPRRLLQDEEGDQQLELLSYPSSSNLQKLWTDGVVGLLAMPICSFLSSSLTQLQLSGSKDMERFSNKHEDALHLLASLQELEFFGFDKLQHLPAGLHKLTNLNELQVSKCPSVRSLPEDGLPSSLQKLDVWDCGNEKLIQQCRGLVGTIPKARLEF
uniref:AAA+ ATPase domain-containing protein n=1 Tax=Aegilops tauschii subsp. strangulata TaxID=200361 RepID=A0A453A6A1_AEGTS